MSASQAAGASSSSQAAGSSSSSPVRQVANAEPEQPQHRWVALVSTAVIFADNDDDARIRAMGSRANVYLDLQAPPRPSYLALHPNRIVALDTAGGDFAYQPTAYILAASDEAGGLLFRVTKPIPDPGDKPTADEIMYLCKTHARRATPLPAVPYSELKVEAQAHRSVGLIVDRGCPGTYLVVQLSPRPLDSVLGAGDKLLCYCTAETSGWFIKPLITTAAVRMRNLCGENGVVAHAGRLYWLALAYGIFVCDPFTETSRLRFIPLPHDCQTWEEADLTGINREYVKQRRRLVPSDGHLRYVEIRGFPYDVFPDDAPPPTEVNPSVRMHTLVDTEVEGEEPQWRLEYEVHFTEVWEHPSYDDAGLKREDVPHVALVDPDDHRVVYFLQDSKLFGLDERTKAVVSCKDCPVRDDRDIMLQNSRPIIDAWKQSPPLPPSPRVQHRRDWVALSSVAVVLGVRDQRAGMIAPGAADLQLDMHTPPRLSYLMLPDRFAPDQRCYGFTSVVAVASDRLLVRATQGDGLQRAAFFLADIHAHTLELLPEAPSLFRADGSRCIGLLPNPHRIDHYLIVQLVPVATGRHECLVTFCTATGRWKVKQLDSAPEHGQWRADGVVAHKDMLWWVDVAHGLLYCDPFLKKPELRFVPLPDACEASPLDQNMRRSSLVHQQRMLRASGGGLHFVEVSGLESEDPAVRIWTLLDEEGWTLEHAVLFDDIWRHRSFATAGLPQDEVPPLAIMDPNNAGMLSFFYGSSVVTVDLRTSSVVAACDECWVDRAERLLSFQRSSFLHAWVPGLIGDKPLVDQGKSAAAIATAEPKSEQAGAGSAEARYERALSHVRDKLNGERRPFMREKLLRERKHVCEELKAAKEAAAAKDAAE